MDDALSGLHTSRSSIRLEQIASLRARGIGDQIDLPQLVVCGDQSAGKSSVLEGLTGLPFPRQDGVCTRFPTEIILQHCDGERTIIATVLPSSSRSDSSVGPLRAYRRQLARFEELPEAIAEAGLLMGMKGFGDFKKGPAFVEDVLRIEVSGPVHLHLTVVDLPGLISVADEEQTERDVQTVHDLVDSYVANPRTIILAVVQATNDIANQGIIQKSKRVDTAGQRTVGIITKPDLINEKTEKRIALLAKNQDTTKLKLGYFLVKNPTPKELENGISSEQRQRNEIKYFESSPWKEQHLDMDRVGIIALRSYLQNLLDQHIERELPKVRQEIRSLMVKTENEMITLGEGRSTTGHLRAYLSRLAMRFHSLATSALNGTYHETDSVFFGGSDTEARSNRLRASVHQLNTLFSDHMRDNGQKRKLLASTPQNLTVFENSSEEGSEGLAEDGQILVSESGMRAWIREVYVNSRGKELPGNYNHVLLSELFYIQSSRWYDIAADHLAALYEVIVAFVDAALNHLTKDDQVLAELVEMTSFSLQKSKQAAEQELEKLHRDEQQQPITYNHYYTDNVQNARQDLTRTLIKKAMDETKSQDWNGKFHVSNNVIDAEKLLASLQKRIVVNMDSQACAEASAGLTAYYQVALKTFVDNVCKQVIERHLLRTLPEIFSPESVASLSNGDLERIAAESAGNVERRRQLQELNESLKDGLRDLRR